MSRRPRSPLFPDPPRETSYLDLQTLWRVEARLDDLVSVMLAADVDRKRVADVQRDVYNHMQYWLAGR